MPEYKVVTNAKAVASSPWSSLPSVVENREARISRTSITPRGHPSPMLWEGQITGADRTAAASRSSHPQERTSPWTGIHRALHALLLFQLVARPSGLGMGKIPLSLSASSPTEALFHAQDTQLQCLLHSQPHLLLLPMDPETLLVTSQSW